jgi:hypothetical protein
LAWESRKRRSYYYTSRRSGSGVAKVYFGGGPLAAVAASLDDQERRRRADQAAAYRADRTRLEPADRALAALATASDLVMAAALTTAGYHRPNYGPWRRRRARRDTER